MTSFEGKQNKVTLAIVCGLIFITVAVAYMTSNFDLIIAPLAVLSLACISVLLVINHNYKVGIFFLIGIGIFMNFVSRVIGRDLPFGVAFDGLIILIFFLYF
jgi:hypothetical protein